MRLHRFIGGFDLSQDTLTIRDREVIHQWKDVLRLKVGESVILCNGKGWEADALIESLDKPAAHVLLSAKRKTTEPDVQVTMYCSLLKRENFELVVQKGTEIGVTRFVPIVSRRTIKTHHSIERLERIAREAAEQCGRGVVPVIDAIRPLESVDTHEQEENIFFAIGDQKTKATKGKPVRTIGLFIGPEGGWDEEEVAWAKKQGMRIIGLGDFVLRGETAAIVASYLAVHHLLAL